MKEASLRSSRHIPSVRGTLSRIGTWFNNTLRSFPKRNLGLMRGGYGGDSLNSSEIDRLFA